MNSDNETLRKKLLEQIDDQAINPKPKVVFRCRECAVWSLWLLSVVVGGMAVAVSLFVIIHHQYDFYEATHENLLTALVDSLPYLWIIIFGLMVLVAIYNIRHTKKGYRYPVWFVLSSSIVLSFALGSSLQYFGLGHTVDKILGQNMAMYMSQEKLESRLWQVPSEGRMIGRQIFTTVSPTSTIVFQDYRGVRWTIDVSELKSEELDLLLEQEKVKLIGRPTDPTLRNFHACGVFPWMMDKPMKLSELSAEREEFVDRMLEHAEAGRKLVAMKETREQTASSSRKKICYQIAPVKKMPTEG